MTFPRFEEQLGLIIIHGNEEINILRFSVLLSIENPMDKTKLRKRFALIPVPWGSPSCSPRPMPLQLNPPLLLPGLSGSLMLWFSSNPENPPGSCPSSPLLLGWSRWHELCVPAAAQSAVLTWSLTTGSHLGLPRSCFINRSCSFAPRCSAGSALILTSQLCRGLAGGRIGWWGSDWLHGVATWGRPGCL